MSDRTDRSGFSNVGTPDSPSTIPQNPLPILYEGFTGLNTKASQQGIQDQEMYICDGYMPLGQNNLRILPDLELAVYTAPGGKTIKNFGFGNIGAAPIMIICLDDGSLIQFNTQTTVQTQIAPAGTITSFDPEYSQWASLYSIIVAAQENGYFLWDGTNLYSSGTIGPKVTVINGGKKYTSAPTITVADVGKAASGTTTWSVVIANGDTATFNGILWTFVTGAPGANQIQILGTNSATVGSLETALNASLNPSLTVADYVAAGGGTNVVITTTYNTVGTAGNAYTLAASVAVVSAGTLTGGVDGGHGVTLVGTVENGSLVSVAVTNPGSDFEIGDLPIATVTGGGSDDSASATPVVSTDSGVASVIVSNGGSGYSALVQVSSSGGGSPSVDASFSIVGQNGVITQVIVQNPGAGYSSAPTLTVTDLASSPVGTGAIISAVMQAGQISSVNVDTHGTGYVSPPTVTVVGDGIGAQVQANISGSMVDSITVVNAGVGYTKAALQFNGGNNSAAVTLILMPFGVSGTTVETYSSRVWVGNGRVGQYSSPGDPANFITTDGAGAFQSCDSFLKVSYQKFIQSNGFLYLIGDSSINYISGVNTSGNPAITTFNNLNVDPQIGTPWPDTVQSFGRDIVFANSIGVYVSYGGAVTKVSDALDGIYSSLLPSQWPVGFAPSASVMTIFGIQVYILLMPIFDTVVDTGKVKCLMWDGKKWWTSPQTGLLLRDCFCASQEINSTLRAFCTPDNLNIQPMFQLPSNFFEKNLYSKLWDKPGIFQTKIGREWFALINVNINDGQNIYLATITENGVQTEKSYTVTATGPVVIGPLVNSDAGKLIGVRMRTICRDVQLNLITMINQNYQSNV